MKVVEEGTRELVVSGGDGAVDFEMADHALDAIALAVKAPVPADRGLSVGARRDDGPDALGAQIAPDVVAVIALVGEHVDGPLLGKRHQGWERRAVRCFAAGEMEDERDALGITETMNFTGEPAPRAAKRLFVSPPFAPAAETWPRIVVESML